MSDDASGSQQGQVYTSHAITVQPKSGPEQYTHGPQPPCIRSALWSPEKMAKYVLQAPLGLERERPLIRWKSRAASSRVALGFDSDMRDLGLAPP